MLGEKGDGRINRSVKISLWRKKRIYSIIFKSKEMTLCLFMRI
jgi:hypothetical protein